MNSFFLDIILYFLGIALFVLFTTTLCRVCYRFRKVRIEREQVQQVDENRNIYFIPFPRSLSRQDSEDHLGEPRHSLEAHMPPQYNAVYLEPPPAYNELAIKPDELPPPYIEHQAPPPPTASPPHVDETQPQTQPQE